MFERILAIVILSASFSAFAQEADRAIHKELRGLLTGIEQAVNNEKYDELAPFFHNKISVTTINQEVITSNSEISAYFRKWFGSGGYLKKVNMKLTADDLTQLYGHKTYGIVRGYGNEDYVLSDGRKFEMKTRWTATVSKNAKGKWKILALHIGTNFLDNPILAKAESSLMVFAGGGLALGGLIGGLAGFLAGRRKRSAA